MKYDPDHAAQPLEGHGSLLVLAGLALLVGAAAGLVGAAFRFALEQADRLRDALIAWAHGERLAGFLSVVATCAAAALLATWLVRRFSPQASGSGIPHVEAVLNEEIPQAPFRLIWVKFVGGLLAIGSGLALGREGPSVQMGASIAHFVGRTFRRNWPDCRVLLAAGAGSGLATAFNAPMAGAVFVLEELVRRFELRIAIVALGASATAIAISRTLLGDAPDFQVGTLAYASAETRPLYFVLGAVAGLVAIVYNRTLLGTIAAAERLSRWPVELRAGLVGAAVGTLAWFAPDLVGGGDPLTQRTLAGAETLVMLPLVFLVRLALGGVSYAAGTSGGLFAPMLVLGAQLGLFFGLLCRLAFPGLDIQPEGFAIVGMAAFFTGVVRAPLTGMVLVTEMTSSVTMLLPMLGACFVAMLVPTLLRDAPIYDSLREHTLRRERDTRLYAEKRAVDPGLADQAR
jgi:chloride channel protein, CIC family